MSTIRGCVHAALTRLHADGHKIPAIGTPARAELVADLDAAYRRCGVADAGAIVAEWRDAPPSLFDVLPD